MTALAVSADEEPVFTETEAWLNLPPNISPSRPAFIHSACSKLVPYPCFSSFSHCSGVASLGPGRRETPPGSVKNPVSKGSIRLSVKPPRNVSASPGGAANAPYAVAKAFSNQGDQIPSDHRTSRGVAEPTNLAFLADPDAKTRHRRPLILSSVAARM